VFYRLIVSMKWLNNDFTKFEFQTAVVQYGPSSLSIEMFSNNDHHDLKTDIQVKGIFTTKVSYVYANLLLDYY
jgi:hypothetical protein